MCETFSYIKRAIESVTVTNIRVRLRRLENNTVLQSTILNHCSFDFEGLRNCAMYVCMYELIARLLCTDSGKHSALESGRTCSLRRLAR